MNRWIRLLLRRCGIDVPFTAVVCPQHVKTIRVGDDARIAVTVRRTLVFLDVPEGGELRDLVPISTDGDSVLHYSPDALELRRTQVRKGLLVHWIPREPIVPYALYVHQYGWSSPAGSADSVLYTEFHCDTRTGNVELEIIAPGRFETAVAFKRPRWRRMATEMSLVKYALRQLESVGEDDRPSIVDHGVRLEWKLAGPKVGDRYVCVAFQQNGIALWQQRLRERSLAGRIRRLFNRGLGPMVPGLGRQS